MKETIKKVIRLQLQDLPSNKALLWPQFEVAFDQMTGKHIRDCMEDMQAAVNELEAVGYVRFEMQPRRMPRILKGVEFDSWT